MDTGQHSALARIKWVHASKGEIILTQEFKIPTFLRNNPKNLIFDHNTAINGKIVSDFTEEGLCIGTCVKYTCHMGESGLIISDLQVSPPIYYATERAVVVDKSPVRVRFKSGRIDTIPESCFCTDLEALRPLGGSDIDVGCVVIVKYGNSRIRHTDIPVYCIRFVNNGVTLKDIVSVKVCDVSPKEEEVNGKQAVPAVEGTSKNVSAVKQSVETVPTEIPLGGIGRGARIRARRHPGKQLKSGKTEDKSDLAEGTAVQEKNPCPPWMSLFLRNSMSSWNAFKQGKSIDKSNDMNGKFGWEGRSTPFEIKPEDTSKWEMGYVWLSREPKQSEEGTDGKPGRFVRIPWGILSWDKNFENCLRSAVLLFMAGKDDEARGLMKSILMRTSLRNDEMSVLNWTTFGSMIGVLAKDRRIIIWTSVFKLQLEEMTELVALVPTSGTVWPEKYTGIIPEIFGKEIVARLHRLVQMRVTCTMVHDGLHLLEALLDPWFQLTEWSNKDLATLIQRLNVFTLKKSSMIIDNDVSNVYMLYEVIRDHMLLNVDKKDYRHQILTYNMIRALVVTLLSEYASTLVSQESESSIYIVPKMAAEALDRIADCPIPHRNFYVNPREYYNLMFLIPYGLMPKV